MIPTEVGKRYARALAELGRESGTLEELTTQLSDLANAYETSSDLRHALENPLVAIDAKRGILNDLAQGVGANAVARNTLLLLGDRRRMRALPEIARALREMRDTEKGVVRAEVASGRPLKPEYAEKLQKELERITGKKIVLEQRIDPSLLAGVVARVGDTIFDGSLKARLDQAKTQMLSN
jgi:F-type H+-transporting ATPase subunit delta